MMFVGLHMRPWLQQMKKLDVIAKILADDVILVAKGANMLETFPRALEKTHRFPHDMGAKVAPSKSFNFSSSKAG